MPTKNQDHGQSPNYWIIRSCKNEGIKDLF